MITLGCVNCADTGSTDRRPEEGRVRQCPLGLLGQQPPEAPIGDLPVVVDVRRQHRVVTLGEQLGETGSECGVICGRRGEAGVAGPEIVRRAHRDNGRRKPLRHRVHDAPVARSGAVDLVDEDKGWHA